MFLVERAMNRLNSLYAVTRIQKILGVLDLIEQQMTDALPRLKAIQVDEIKLRNGRDEVSEQDELEHEYRRWAIRMAEQMGVPVNPAARRFSGGVVTPMRVVSGC
jgi:hypothetical protein